MIARRALLAGASTLVASPALALPVIETRHPRTSQLISRMDSAPSGERVAAIDALVRELHEANVWQKLDRLWVLAAHNEQAARLNWIPHVSGTLTATNSPTFTADKGFTGDAVSAYLQDDTSLASLTNYALNDAHISIWNLAGIARNSDNIGATEGANRTRIQCERANTNTTVNINSSTGLALAIPPSGVVGWFFANRTSATNVAAWTDGVDRGDNANNSTAIPNVPIDILGNSVDGSYQDSQTAAVTVGASLNDTEALALYNALNSHLSAVGAV